MQAVILYDSTHLIDIKLRNLLKDCQEAQRITQLLSLNRFESYVYSNQIDWETTYRIFELKLWHGPSSKQQRTTASLHTFRLKLFYDELPTLQNLQVRRADLYSQYTNCPSCNLMPETLNHLWTCSNSIDITRSLIMEMKRSIDRILSSKKYTGYSQSFQSRFNNLNCWNLALAHDTQAVDLIRGLIPNELTQVMGSIIGSQQLIASILFNQITKLQKNIYNNVWMPRCQHFSQWERSNNITVQQKRSRTATGLQSSGFSQPHHFSRTTRSNIKRPHLNHYTNWIQLQLQKGGSWLNYLSSNFICRLTVRVGVNII
jgi:hypothetical protein